MAISSRYETSRFVKMVVCLRQGEPACDTINSCKPDSVVSMKRREMEQMAAWGALITPSCACAEIGLVYFFKIILSRRCCSDDGTF